MSTTHTVIGVDVGGTKVAAALLRVEWSAEDLLKPSVRSLPEVLARADVATDVTSQTACLAGIDEVIRGVQRGERPAEAIGVGIAAFVDFAHGVAVDSVHLPLSDVPVRSLLEGRHGTPVAIDNDATAACIGEHRFGAGRGVDEMIMLTLGTGVGGGIVCGGRPYRGRRGVAAEFGHMVIEAGGEPCPGNCPNRGCLEAYVSGHAMGRAAREAARANPASCLGRALAAGVPVDGALLTRLALGGDWDAIAIVARLGGYLGVGLTSLVNVFNPELIVIGGGAAAAGDVLLEPARRVVERRALRPARDHVRIVAAGLGPDAGVYGAAALALMECISPPSATR